MLVKILQCPVYYPLHLLSSFFLPFLKSPTLCETEIHSAMYIHHEGVYCFKK